MIGPSADIYSLGVMLYELLSGALPFHAADTRRLEQEIRAGYGQRPLPDTCPAGLRAIVRRLLAAQPIDRYPSAAAVMADLDRVRAGQDPEALTFAFHESADEAPTRRTRPADASDPEATRRTDRSLSRAKPATTAVAATPAQVTTPKAWVPPSVKVKRSRLRTALMIGALPHTEWLAAVVQRDAHGYLVTGADVSEGGRRPTRYETSMPGVFAAGDVRHGSEKRVASAVGEGAVAVRDVHDYLAAPVAVAPRKTAAWTEVSP